MALIYAVEDDKNILEIEMFALKNSGYQVEGFECAHDFYKKLEEKQPDLVLLDIMLPDEDGLEIVAKLRRRPETKKLPVIMVTAKSTEIDKVKGLDVGALIGGVLLGIIEILSKAYISSQLSDAIVFSVLIIVLLVRPTGILGKKLNEKV